MWCQWWFWMASESFYMEVWPFILPNLATKWQTSAKSDIYADKIQYLSVLLCQSIITLKFIFFCILIFRLMHFLLHNKMYADAIEINLSLLSYTIEHFFYKKDELFALMNFLLGWIWKCQPVDSRHNLSRDKKVLIHLRYTNLDQKGWLKMEHDFSTCWFYSALNLNASNVNQNLAFVTWIYF